MFESLCYNNAQFSQNRQTYIKTLFNFGDVVIRKLPNVRRRQTYTKILFNRGGIVRRSHAHIYEKNTLDIKRNQKPVLRP